VWRSKDEWLCQSVYCVCGIETLKHSKSSLVDSFESQRDCTDTGALSLGDVQPTGAPCLHATFTL
jgi:hypothetical protein